MVEYLKQWIMNICVVVFFVTAVEMLLPDNKLKKYSKFVLGLIIMTVLMKPIVTIFDKNFDIDAYAAKAAQSLDEESLKQDFEKYKQESMSTTVDNFNSNLKTYCEKLLKEKLPGKNFQVEFDTHFDEKEEKFVIEKVKVGVKDGKIEKIKKVRIQPESKSVTNDKEKVDISMERTIKELISAELKVSDKIISVYKM